jgi:type II secretory pathway pseudopilin PulG
MKGGPLAYKKPSGGFTIIELLIFIIVSSFIFVAAMHILSGKQNRTEFSVGLASFISQLNTQINNVSTGYYQVPSSSSCVLDPTSPIPTPYYEPTTSPLATNNAICTFVGEVIGFKTSAGDSSTPEIYKVYPVLGLHYKANLAPTEATSLSDAHPQISSDLNSIEDMPYGLTVYSINNSNSGAIGLFTTFSSYIANTNSSQLNGASQNIRQVVLPGDNLIDNSGDAGNNLLPIVNNLTDASCTGYADGSAVCDSTTPSDSAPFNPAGGINICVNSGTDDQSAELTLNSTSSESSYKIFDEMNCL